MAQPEEAAVEVAEEPVLQEAAALASGSTNNTPQTSAAATPVPAVDDEEEEIAEAPRAPLEEPAGAEAAGPAHSSGGHASGIQRSGAPTPTPGGFGGPVFASQKSFRPPAAPGSISLSLLAAETGASGRYQRRRSSVQFGGMRASHPGAAPSVRPKPVSETEASLTPPASSQLQLRPPGLERHRASIVDAASVSLFRDPLPTPERVALSKRRESDAHVLLPGASSTVQAANAFARLQAAGLLKPADASASRSSSIVNLASALLPSPGPHSRRASTVKMSTRRVSGGAAAQDTFAETAVPLPPASAGSRATQELIARHKAAAQVAFVAEMEAQEKRTGNETVIERQERLQREVLLREMKALERRGSAGLPVQLSAVELHRMRMLEGMLASKEVTTSVGHNMNFNLESITEMTMANQRNAEQTKRQQLEEAAEQDRRERAAMINRMADAAVEEDRRRREAAATAPPKPAADAALHHQEQSTPSPKLRVTAPMTQVRGGGHLIVPGGPTARDQAKVMLNYLLDTSRPNRAAAPTKIKRAFGSDIARVIAVGPAKSVPAQVPQRVYVGEPVAPPKGSRPRVVAPAIQGVAAKPAEVALPALPAASPSPVKASVSTFNFGGPAAALPPIRGARR